MKTNKILFGVLAIGFASLSISCDDFFDRKPTDSVLATESVTTVAEAQVALNGVYRRMTQSAYYGRQFLFYADMKGGDFYVPSSGRSDDALFSFNHEHDRNSYSGYWNGIYSIIMLSNSLLANIERGNVTTLTAADQTNLENIKGQALCVRALAHFDLVRLYGTPYLKSQGSEDGVPVVKRVLDAKDQLQRNSVAEVYAAVIQDFTEAIPLLKTARLNGGFNQYAAKALLARVNLYKGDWDQAYTLAKDVIDNGGYSLYTPANWAASWKSQFGSESIFELYVVNTEADLGNSSPRSFLTPMYVNTSYLAGAVCSDLYLNRLNEDATDVRQALLDIDEYGNPIRNPERSIPGRKGWLRKYDGDGKATGTAVNIKVVRLSEVYMIAAEAAVKKSSPDKANAVSWLNEVRKRAPLLAPALAAESTDALMDKIMNERAKELIAEGHRYFDLMRQGLKVAFDPPKFSEPTIPANGRPAEPFDWNFYKCILPIGVDEINTNPDIRQNPGYSK